MPPHVLTTESDNKTAAVYKTADRRVFLAALTDTHTRAAAVRVVLRNLCNVYLTQWGVSALAILGLALAMQCAEQCSRGYLPTLAEINEGE